MDGITSVNKHFKTIHIIFTFIVFIILGFFSYRLFTVNYANIYQYDRASGIEHLPLYFCITIVLCVIFIISIIILLFNKQYNIKMIFVYMLFILFITISIILGIKLPNVTEYSSSLYNQSQSEYLPIDEFEYNENSTDYYYYRNVSIGDIYWIGSSSYKDFAAENTMVDLTEDVSESTVFMNYYYLFDDSGYLVKDYSKKKIWYDILSVDNYETEKQIDNYKVYEYQDCYELILEENNEIFYLSASKNKRTKYDENELVVIANKLTNKLRETQKQVAIS